MLMDGVMQKGQTPNMNRRKEGIALCETMKEVIK